MSTANATPNTAMQHLIDQRLDALDQALLGLVPRNERLALVAHAEHRIRELAAAGSVASLAPIPHSFLPAFSGMAPSSGKRRSRLAFSAGVLGIAALALLFGIPVTYLFVATVGELLGEVVSISLLGAHLLAVAIGGVTAVGLGTAALVILGRRKGSLEGRGWAIAGLCTGPVPMLVGGLALIVGGWQFLAANDLFGESAVAYEPPDATESSPSESSAPDDFEETSATSNSTPLPNGVIRIAGHRTVGEPAPCATTSQSPDQSLECDLPAASFEQTGPVPGAFASTSPENPQTQPPTELRTVP